MEKFYVVMRQYTNSERPDGSIWTFYKSLDAAEFARDAPFEDMRYMGAIVAETSAEAKAAAWDRFTVTDKDGCLQWKWGSEYEIFLLPQGELGTIRVSIKKFTDDWRKAKEELLSTEEYEII